ncbi:MAG TPA: hypothetical protein VGO47_00875 [Chlamydiales bacterium]|nr:hypothetical protein [Chlamydiales bacterium]
MVADCILLNAVAEGRGKLMVYDYQLNEWCNTSSRTLEVVFEREIRLYRVAELMDGDCVGLEAQVKAAQVAYQYFTLGGETYREASSSSSFSGSSSPCPSVKSKGVISQTKPKQIKSTIQNVITPVSLSGILSTMYAYIRIED